MESEILGKYPSGRSGGVSSEIIFEKIVKSEHATLRRAVKMQKCKGCQEEKGGRNERKELHQNFICILSKRKTRRKNEMSNYSVAQKEEKAHERSEEGTGG